MNEYDDKKYISCKNCGCEIEADQHKCPYCKTINPLAPKRKVNKLLVIIPVIIVVVIAVAAFLIFNRTSGDDAALNPHNIKIYSVMNGTGTKSIGNRAEIAINKEYAKTLSSQEFNSFIETEVADGGYNWFTIIFSDGTGIVFSNCDITMSTYGKIGEEGMVQETIAFINRTKTDDIVSFEYIPKS